MKSLRVATPPDRHPRRLRSCALFLCAAAFVALAHAAPETQPAEAGDARWIEETNAALDTSERRIANLERADAPKEALDAVRATAARVRNESETCLAAIESHRASFANRLEAIGEATVAESVEVRDTRETLRRERAQLEGRESACRLVRLRAQELTAVANAKAQALMTERLLVRGPHLGDVLSEMLANPWSQVTAVAGRIAGPATRLAWHDAALLVLLVIAGVLGGRVGARMIGPSRGPEVADCVCGSAIALRAAAARTLPVLLASLAVSLYLAWATGLASDGAKAGYAVTSWLLVLTVVRAMLRPPPPAQPFLPLVDAFRRSLFVRVTVLSVLLLLGFLAFALIPWSSDTEPPLLLLRALYAGALAFNLSWILALAGNFLKGAVWRVLRGMAAALLLVALGAEWLGYHVLAPYLLRGVAGTVLVLIAGTLLARFFADLFDGLDEGRLRWQERLRTRLGLTSRIPIPGLTWLRVAATLLIWGAGGYLVLLSWGLSAEGAAMLGRWMTEGVAIGDVQLVPTQLLAALMMFGVLTTAVRWMRQRVVPLWLRRTRLDTGSREAVTAIASYTGMAVAVVIALSMAGIRFQNLAIIAGALSVGIGFGLQNIVNNFVSGLILLFERPIRRGDWIEVGNTQGYVRKISIRSTRLETFDRSEVIIPNAELVTTQVINWQLHDAWGRLTVPVAVAYGSDIELVRKILLRVAHAHPNTMRDAPTVPNPIVLFRGFGESSLDFELRFFIPQVDQRLIVISDVYFAIDAAFREEGIQIPFPQRDVHLKGPLSDPGQA
mgnify:CR=1 FL=1